LPCPFNGALLPERVRGGDTLALPIAAPSYRADDGINLIAVPFRVRQPLQQQHHGSFAHHKPVGAIRVRPRSIRAERANFAELDKTFRPHVPVHPPGQGSVKLIGI